MLTEVTLHLCIPSLFDVGLPCCVISLEVISAKTSLARTRQHLPCKRGDFPLYKAKKKSKCFLVVG